MLIRCKLIRAGGTRVEIGKSEHHFIGKSDEDLNHVCEVTNREHIAKLLTIPEAYELVDVEQPKGRGKSGKKAGESQDTPSADGGDESPTSDEQPPAGNDEEPAAGDK